MNTKVIFLAGVPCSGKTTIFKRIRGKLFQDYTEIKHKSLRLIKSGAGNYYMFGVFDGSTFEGTDRLSMCVINDALDFIKNLEKNGDKNVVFIEGDRLFNNRFLTETQAELYVTSVVPEIIAMRHKQRNDNQTERFLRSRQTKLYNILNKYPCSALLLNNTALDSELAACRLCSVANRYLNKGDSKIWLA